ncbi:hypothetical protein HY095_04975 [Candidatus Micrarchaeota archaeon]|nr:hypothetical protein [Candidatus Micrarchaeota archaeon]
MVYAVAASADAGASASADGGVAASASPIAGVVEGTASASASVNGNAGGALRGLSRVKAVIARNEARTAARAEENRERALAKAGGKAEAFEERAAGQLARRAESSSVGGEGEENATVRAEAAARVMAARQEAVKARENFKAAEERVKAARKTLAEAKGELNARERGEYRAAVKAHVVGQLVRIVTTVGHLEAQGYVSANLSAEIKAYAQSAQARWDAATTVDARKALIDEFNAKWVEFKERIRQEILAKRVSTIVSRYGALQAKIEASIAGLASQGKDTSKLESLDSKLKADLQALQSSTITPAEASFRLNHLAWAVRMMLLVQQSLSTGAEVNGGETAEPTESIGASEGESARASASVGASASALASPSVSVSAGASPSVSAGAS